MKEKMILLNNIVSLLHNIYIFNLINLSIIFSNNSKYINTKFVNDWDLVENRIYKISNYTIKYYLKSNNLKNCEKSNEIYLENTTCSYSSCTSKHPPLTCNENYNYTLCPNCIGLNLNDEHSGIHFDPDQITENLQSDSVLSSILFTSKLDEIFVETSEKLTYWNYIYFASRFYRIFPYVKYCDDSQSQGNFQLDFYSNLINNTTSNEENKNSNDFTSSYSTTQNEEISLEIIANQIFNSSYELFNNYSYFNYTSENKTEDELISYSLNITETSNNTEYSNTSFSSTTSQSKYKKMGIPINRYFYNNPVYGKKVLVFVLDFRTLNINTELKYEILRYIFDNLSFYDYFTLFIYNEKVRALMPGFTVCTSNSYLDVIRLLEKAYYFGQEGFGIVNDTLNILDEWKDKIDRNDTFIKQCSEYDVKNDCYFTDIIFKSNADIYIIFIVNSNSNSFFNNSEFDLQIRLILKSMKKRIISSYKKIKNKFRFIILDMGNLKEKPLIGNYLSCMTNGLYLNINKYSEFIFLESLFLYFRLGRTNENIIWTQPYIDVISNRILISASKPVFDYRFTPALLIAVVVNDVEISNIIFQEPEFFKFNEVLKKKLELFEFNRNSLTPCQLNNIRGLKCDETADDFFIDYDNIDEIENKTSFSFSNCKVNLYNLPIQFKIENDIPSNYTNTTNSTLEYLDKMKLNYEYIFINYPFKNLDSSLNSANLNRRRNILNTINNTTNNTTNSTETINYVYTHYFNAEET